jgi:hypothetical protein
VRLAVPCRNCSSIPPFRYKQNPNEKKRKSERESRLGFFLFEYTPWLWSRVVRQGSPQPGHREPARAPRPKFDFGNVEIVPLEASGEGTYLPLGFLVVGSLAPRDMVSAPAIEEQLGPSGEGAGVSGVHPVVPSCRVQVSLDLKCF